MNEEGLISPITFFKPGQCPYCSGVLMVVDSETTCMILGDDGMPIKEDTMIRCEGVCQGCGEHFQMMRHGFGYRVESRSFKLFSKFDRQKKLQHTDVKDNPFCDGKPETSILDMIFF